MRAALLACLIALTSAVAHAQAIAPADIPVLERDCVMLMSKIRVSAKMGMVVPSESLTKTILLVRPVRVTVEEEGVYITTTHSLGHESGFFCVSNDTPAWQDWVKSSGWELVGSRLYKFERRVPRE